MAGIERVQKSEAIEGNRELRNPNTERVMPPEGRDAEKKLDNLLDRLSGQETGDGGSLPEQNPQKDAKFHEISNQTDMGAEQEAPDPQRGAKLLDNLLDKAAEAQDAKSEARIEKKNNIESGKKDFTSLPGEKFSRHDTEQHNPGKEISPRAPLSDLETISNKAPEQLVDGNNELESVDQEIPSSHDLKESVGTMEKDPEGTDNKNDSGSTSEIKGTNEDHELSEDEINAKQVEAIKEGFGKIRNGEFLTNEERGNLGEMMMDQYFISQGYRPLNIHRVSGLEDSKEGFKTGIDGIYEKTKPDGMKQFFIVDAKYNGSQLIETNDGKQMSWNWIDKRLNDAVGKEKANEIRELRDNDPNSVKPYVYRIIPNVDESGRMNSDLQELDENANNVGKKRIVERFDKNGNRIESKSPEDGE